jgi:hypothetical protein
METFNHRHYAIIRIPYKLFPAKYMDETNVTRQRISMTESLFNNEYNTIFSKDSNGFYKMSLIEKCTCKEPIYLPGGPVMFSARQKGDVNKRYVFGIDPAYEKDNLAIVILEVHGDHRRVVHCWTTNNENHKKRLQMGLVKENEYNSFVSRKIRQLMQTFRPEIISIDSQGGGKALAESLHDTDKLLPGETPIWEIRSDHPLSYKKEEKYSDNLAGEHIIEMVQFANYEWYSMAHNGLKKDMEDQAIIFPNVDAIELVKAFHNDMEIEGFDKFVPEDGSSPVFDTLDDCVKEIQELKNETSSIIVTKTGTQTRDHWDTPEIKEGLTKGRMKKDRFSALVMANAAARRLERHITPTVELTPGIVKGTADTDMMKSKLMISAPDWWNKDIGNFLKATQQVYRSR